METKEKLKSKIKGWGIDADIENDPTYPIKNRTNEEHKGYTWDRPVQQEQTVEILHSNERPNLSSVYGTSSPPRGLSGLIRRLAFKYSENRYRHWLPLVLADRIDVFEGVLDDLRHGHIPDYAAEKGLKVLWKYKPKTFTQRVAIRVGLLAATVGLIFRKKLTASR